MQHLLWCFPVPESEMRPMTSSAGAGRGHLMDTQSLVPAVQELWNVWEIHIMFLISLSLQVLLFLFGGLRRRSSNWLLQTVLWLAYLSADSVAVFVLGHLAVRVREPGHELMSLWAPFVLVHLGGQDTMTALSKQDNELWKRHLLNLVLQAGIAGYVVAKAAWPDARLRAAMVLILVCGCFKYAERILCLWAADKEFRRGLDRYALWRKLKGVEIERGVGRMTKRRALTGLEDTVHNIHLMSKGSALSPDVLLWKAVAVVEHIISVDAPVASKSHVAVDAPVNAAGSVTAAHHGTLHELLRSFLGSESHRHSAYEHVGALLEYCYRGFYTKDLLRLVFVEYFDQFFPCPILKTCLRILFLPCLLLSMLLSTAIAASIALALFTAVHKSDQLHTSSRADITVTYALLLGAIALDVASAAIFVSRHYSFYLPACLACRCTKRKHWSQQLAQYNIISTAGVSDIWPWFGCDVSSTHVTEGHGAMKMFILDSLSFHGTRKEWNSASTHGMLALQKWKYLHQQHDDNQSSALALKSLEQIVESSADFPTSVLVLHIATDICYHYGDAEGTNSNSCQDEDREEKERLKETSTQLSNYIMYLVFKCGVMLTTKSQIVHDDTREEILKVLSPDSRVCSLLQSQLWYNTLFGPGNHKDGSLKLFDTIKKQQQESDEQQDAPTEMIMIMDEESSDISDGDAAHHIKELQKNSTVVLPRTMKLSVLPHAVAVAQELLSISNEAERWELIAKVWVEMLYYTAPRFGAAFHYEHLCTGGEFVTHVLVLMYLLGPFMPPLHDAPGA